METSVGESEVRESGERGMMGGAGREKKWKEREREDVLRPVLREGEGEGEEAKWMEVWGAMRVCATQRKREIWNVEMCIISPLGAVVGCVRFRGLPMPPIGLIAAVHNKSQPFPQETEGRKDRREGGREGGGHSRDPRPLTTLPPVTPQCLMGRNKPTAALQRERQCHAANIDYE
ncbi:unnamed protein product [Pleuronectes platessa]|uniref:Uncharacterized protein n=1 Tax=Pleuronectes platessa TaxID=8262 RepID=A0A9N7Z1D5_PLEPL|nr:unnamed protein product [Pleuronectes platessa]